MCHPNPVEEFAVTLLGKTLDVARKIFCITHAKVYPGDAAKRQVLVVTLNIQKTVHGVLSTQSELVFGKCSQALFLYQQIVCSFGSSCGSTSQIQQPVQVIAL